MNVVENGNEDFYLVYSLSKFRGNEPHYHEQIYL